MVKAFCQRFLYRLLHEDIPGYSAQITFYLIMSLLPFLIFVGMMLTRTHLVTAEGIITLMNSIRAIPEAAKDVIASVFTTINHEGYTYFPFYLIVVLYAASKSIRGITGGIHMVYRTVETRPFPVRFLISFLYTIALAVMIVLFVALVLFGEMLSKAAFTFLGLDRFYSKLITYLRYLLPTFFMFLLYMVLYKFIPTIRLRFRDVFPGALFATLASFIVSTIFSYSVSDTTRYTTLYGGISQIIVIIVWLYFISMIQLLGALVNATIYEVRHSS